MRNLFLTFLIGLVMASCITPYNSTLNTKRILVGPGPEDMVIQRSDSKERLLISCTARREGDSPFGEIVAYCPATGSVDTLLRTGTPDSLFFQPHGIFLDSLSSPQILYAISHEHDQGFHPVYLWEVHGDTLVYKELVYSDLVYSPNALTLGEHGEIYIVNDCGKRGSTMEKIFRLKRANIVRLTKESDINWKAEVVAEKLGYPAGINRYRNTLYAGDAVLNRIHVYAIEGTNLIEQAPMKGLIGNDNIRIVNGQMFVAGHVKPFKFIAHVKSSENLSPVEVWKINPETGKVSSLFYTDGSLISAGSTALLLDNTLYICQVFDPFILGVDLQEIP